jgi:predicted RNase H-like HicB family nuclease
MLRKTERGMIAWCPGLPGCRSIGETEEEALRSIREEIVNFLWVDDESEESLVMRFVEVN